MKKFLFCVLAGYVLIFVLFIGLPQLIHSPKSQNTALEHQRPSGRTDLKGAMQSKQGLPEIPEKIVNQSQLSPTSRPFLQKNFETGSIETFYRNGTLSSEWTLSPDGRGLLKTYTKEGQPWIELPFNNQKLQGEIKIFYADGPLMSREKHSGGDLPIDIQWFYKNGTLWLDWVWNVDDLCKFKGLYSESGQAAQPPEVSTVPGAGYFKAFDASGKEVVNWKATDTGEESVLTSYYKDGKKSAEVYLRAENLTEKLFLYDMSGALMLEMRFSEKGQWIEKSLYGEKEQIQFQQKMKSQTEWEWTTYYPDGNLFWDLILDEASNGTLLYHLSTHWQDEPLNNRSKEEVLL